MLVGVEFSDGRPATAVSKANDVFTEGPVTVQEVMRCCGAGPGTPSQRAKALLGGIDVDASEYAYDPVLGSPDHPTAACRSRMIAARDGLNR